MINYKHNSTEHTAINLAQVARHNGKEGDTYATREAVQLLDEYYKVNSQAFSIDTLTPLSYRDLPMRQAIFRLEDEYCSTPQQTKQLAILNSAIELESQLLEYKILVPVLPDIHHWNFTRPQDTERPYRFTPNGKQSLTAAWEELRYAGLLSNPYDPEKIEFDADFVLDPQRMSDQAKVISQATGLSRERLLHTVFVNAAQVMGRRIVNGTSQGQAAPTYWADLADTSEEALTLC